MEPEILLGPPGTGKTTSLLQIVEDELKRGIPPDRIAYVSFTRRAAEEAISRACEKFNLSRSDFPYFRTIHSLAFKELGIRNNEIFEGSKIYEFAKWMGIRVTGRYSEDGTLSGLETGDKILFMENLARVKQVPLRTLYNQSNENFPWSQLERVALGLRKFKQENGLIDFTDLLEIYVKSGRKPLLDVLLCDEVQDQSALQWKVIEKLAINTRRVVLAGDDDQSIYQWAGADVARMISQPGKVRVLEQSYRVPKQIQDLAFSVIDRVHLRRNKIWSPRSGTGVIERVPNFFKSDYSGDNVLILARNTFLIKDIIEPELRRNGILYEKNGVKSVKESMIQAIVDWEQLRSGSPIPVSRAINVYEYMASNTGVKRGFKKLPQFQESQEVNLPILKESGGLLTDRIWHEALERISLEDRRYIIAARRRGEKILGEPRIRISSIHTAKGAEAQHVILLKEQAKKTHRDMEKDSDAEHRVFYVGITRAKERLTIVDSSTDKYYPFI